MSTPAAATRTALITPAGLTGSRTAYVWRGDRLPYGLKAAALRRVMQPGQTYVNAGQLYGSSTFAVAYAARRAGARAVCVVPPGSRGQGAAPLLRLWGAEVVRPGAAHMSCLVAAARKVEGVPAPDGVPGYANTLTDILREEWAGRPAPPEVWCAAGSGTLARCARRAFPRSKVYAVRVGASPDAGPGVLVLPHPDPYNKPARHLPRDFATDRYYGGKVWDMAEGQAAHGSLIINAWSGLCPAPEE